MYRRRYRTPRRTAPKKFVRRSNNSRSSKRQGWPVITAIVSSVATVVIAFGTVRYWMTTENMLSQMRQQTLQTQENIKELRKSNENMRKAYAEAIRNNQILQKQFETQIEQLFDDKLQLHYDLKKERDRVGKKIEERRKREKLPPKPLWEIEEYKFFQKKMEANYQALVNLSKKYTPLGGRLARFAKQLPPALDLTPPAVPKILNIKETNHD